MFLYYLMIFLLPFFAVSPWQKLMGVPVGLIYGGVVLLTLLWYLFKLGLGRFKNNLLDTPLMAGLLTYILINGVSLAMANGFSGLAKENLVKIIYLAFSVLVFWLVTNLAEDLSTILTSIYGFVTASVLASLYGLYQTGGFMLGLNTGQEVTWTVPRLFGTATEPQVFGNLLVAAVLLAAGLMMAKGNGRRFFMAFATGIMLLAMVMTFSAGAWVGLAAGLFFLVLGFAWLDGRRIIGFLLIIFIVAAGIVGIDKYVYPQYHQGFPSLFVKFGDQTLQEAKGNDKLSALSREDRQWFRAAAWKMFREHPVIGVGSGNFTHRYNSYRPEDAPKVSYPAKAHNQYLEILAETGIMGFGAFVLVLLQLVLLLWQGLLAMDNEYTKAVTWSLTSALVGLGVHGLAFGIFVHNYFWVVFGLTCAAARLPYKGMGGYLYENRFGG